MTGEELLRALTREAETAPEKVLVELGTSHPVLSEVEQSQISQLALSNLERSYLQGPATPERAESLGRIRSACSTRQRLRMPEEGLKVTALEIELRSRLRCQAYEGIGDHLANGRWSQAATEAKTKLGEQGLSRQADRVLREVVEHGEARDAAQLLQAAVDQSGLEFARTWHGAPKGSERFPSQLRDMARRHAALAELRASLYEFPAEVENLKHDVAVLAETTGDRVGAKILEQDLAAKAFYEGKPSQARELLPADGPPDHAAALLDDVKAMIVGREKNAAFWPAHQAQSAMTASGAISPRGPPEGIRLIVPESSPSSYRPSTSGSAATSGLPSLFDPITASDFPVRDFARLEQSVGQQLRAALGQQAAKWNNMGPPLLRSIHTMASGHEESEEERRFRASLTSLLDLRSESLLESSVLLVSRDGTNTRSPDPHGQKEEGYELLRWWVATLVSWSPALFKELRAPFSIEEWHFVRSQQSQGKSISQIADAVLSLRLSSAHPRLTPGQLLEPGNPFISRMLTVSRRNAMSGRIWVTIAQRMIAEYETSIVFEDPFQH
jgi:hypothetical protein